MPPGQEVIDIPMNLRSPSENPDRSKAQVVVDALHHIDTWS